MSASANAKPCSSGCACDSASTHQHHQVHSHHHCNHQLQPTTAATTTTSTSTSASLQQLQKEERAALLWRSSRGATDIVEEARDELGEPDEPDQGAWVRECVGT